MSHAVARSRLFSPSFSPCCSSASATISAPGQNADSDERLAALRAEVELLRQASDPEPTGTTGTSARQPPWR